MQQTASARLDLTRLWPCKIDPPTREKRGRVTWCLSVLLLCWGVAEEDGAREEAGEAFFLHAVGQRRLKLLSVLPQKSVLPGYLINNVTPDGGFETGGGMERGGSLKDDWNKFTNSRALA